MIGKFFAIIFAFLVAGSAAAVRKKDKLSRETRVLEKPA